LANARHPCTLRMSAFFQAGAVKVSAVSAPLDGEAPEGIRARAPRLERRAGLMPPPCSACCLPRLQDVAPDAAASPERMSAAVQHFHRQRCGKEGPPPWPRGGYDGLWRRALRGRSAERSAQQRAEAAGGKRGCQMWLVRPGEALHSYELVCCHGVATRRGCKRQPCWQKPCWSGSHAWEEAVRSCLLQPSFTAAAVRRCPCPLKAWQVTAVGVRVCTGRAAEEGMQ